MSTIDFFPESYISKLNIYDTQKAIGVLKRLFEDNLCGHLHLRRVSAPLFVEKKNGKNKPQKRCRTIIMIKCGFRI